MGGVTAIMGVLVFMIITAKLASYFVHYKVEETRDKRTEKLLLRLEELQTKEARGRRPMGEAKRKKRRK